MKCRSIAFLFVFALLAFWIQSYRVADFERESGYKALASQDFPKALFHFRRALSQQVPLSNIPLESAAVIEAILRHPKSNLELREKALEAFRRGVFTRRSWILETLREDAFHRRLKELEAEFQYTDIPAPKTFQADAYTPKPGYYLSAQLGFWIWICSGLLLAWRGLGAEGKIQKRPALIFSLTFLAGFFLWAWSLTLA